MTTSVDEGADDGGTANRACGSSSGTSLPRTASVSPPMRTKYSMALGARAGADSADEAIRAVGAGGVVGLAEAEDRFFGAEREARDFRLHVRLLRFVVVLLGSEVHRIHSPPRNVARRAAAGTARCGGAEGGKGSSGSAGDETRRGLADHLLVLAPVPVLDAPSA